MKRFTKILHNRALFLAAIVLVAGIVSFGVVRMVSANNNRSITKQQCNGTCINLFADKAVPDTIAVPVGTYVQFNSKDGKTHDLAQGEGGHEHVHTGKFQSGDFKGDEAWRVQFTQDGHYYFHDHLNPEISILVVVYTPGKDYKIQ